MDTQSYLIGPRDLVMNLFALGGVSSGSQNINNSLVRDIGFARTCYLVEFCWLDQQRKGEDHVAREGRSLKTNSLKHTRFVP